MGPDDGISTNFIDVSTSEDELLGLREGLAELLDEAHRTLGMPDTSTLDTELKMREAVLLLLREDPLQQVSTAYKTLIDLAHTLHGDSDLDWDFVIRIVFHTAQVWGMMARVEVLHRELGLQSYLRPEDPR